MRWWCLSVHSEPFRYYLIELLYLYPNAKIELGQQDAENKMSTAANQKKVNIKTVFEIILSADLQPHLEIL